MLALAKDMTTEKKPSKETLNHPGLIYLASGHYPYKETPAAFMEAYRSLGIDLINRVPEENAPEPLKPGETRDEGDGITKAHLGVYDTFANSRFAFRDADEFLKAEKIEPEYENMRLPIPHSPDKETIERKMALAGEIGLYYYGLYTTIFMWGVEYLGWEVFMTAAAMDPERFNEKFLEVVYGKTEKILEILSSIDSPFVFCHDDLADNNGPVFHPDWYDRYIFPKYKKLWEPLIRKGKKIIFIADGNMGPFLTRLKECGVYGVMLENPATDFDLILKHFGDGIVIGGINTRVLTFGRPDEIRKHTIETNGMTEGMPGYVMSTPGGIHGNIPLENLEAYFDARVITGHTPEGWRKKK